MKILVERDSFAAALSAAMRVGAKGHTIPILNNLLLRPNGKAVGILATNLDLQLETSVPAEIDGTSNNDGAITVIGDALAGIVSRLPKGSQLTLSWDDPKAGAVLVQGRSRYRLSTLPVSDFPEPFRPKEPARFSLPAKELVAALTAIHFAVGKDKTRPYLCGIYIHASDDAHQAFGGSREPRLSFVATNGCDLGRVGLSLPTGAENFTPFILPDITIPEVIRMVKDFDGDVAIEASPALVTFTAGEIVFTTKLIDATFPDYMRVIPADTTRRVMVDCDQLLQALTRLCSIGDGVRTRVELGDGKATFTLANRLVGEAEETLEIEWEGGPLTIGLRAESLITILNTLQSDQCVIRFQDERTPVLVQQYRAGKVDTSPSYVSMPVIVG